MVKNEKKYDGESKPDDLYNKAGNTAKNLWQRVKSKAQDITDTLSDEEKRNELKEKVITGTKKAYDATTQAVGNAYDASKPTVESIVTGAKNKLENITEMITGPKPKTKEEREAERQERAKKNTERLSEAKDALAKFKNKYKND